MIGGCHGVQRDKVVIVAVVLAYGLITVFMTYPVIFQLTSALAGLPMEDAVGKMWMLWWTKKALLDLQINPANLTHLYHPSEPYHPLLIVYPFLQLHALPLLLVFGPITAYNVEFLLSFVLTGVTTYMLCYYLTNNHLASFVGGVIFAFFPNKMLHSMGHLPLITLYLFPLYVLFLFLLLDKPDVRRGLSLGLILALSLLVHIVHIAYFLIPFTLVFFLWHLYSDRPKILAPDFLRAFALACLIAGVLTMPLFGPFLTDELSGKLAYLRAGGSDSYSADLLSFITPSSDHPLLGGILRDMPIPVPSHKSDETLVYLGLITLALAAIGSVGHWRCRGLWIALGLVAVVLACGPVLKVGGQVVQLAVGGKEWPIPLPYALLQRLPFYQWGRTPARLTETMMLPLAILASCGAASLATRLRTVKGRAGLVAGLTALILFEYIIVFPFPTGHIPIPEFYRQLAADSEEYAVLDVPLGGWEANHTGMYYQLVHGQRIVGGFIHRVPVGVRPMIRVFKALITPPVQGDTIVEPLSGPERAALLSHYDIVYVVLHKRLLAAGELQALRELLEPLSSETTYEDDHILAFAVPEGRRDSASGVSLLMLGDGWYPREYSDGEAFRWMANEARIDAWVQDTGEYRLRITAQPFIEPRHRQVFVGDQLVAEYHVGGLQSHVTSRFLLKGGEWTSIRFSAPEGCDIAKEILEGSEDDRCLSILLREVSIEASG